MSEHTPGERSQEQELVEVLKALIASVPGEGQMQKVCYLLMAVGIAAALSSPQFIQCVSHAIARLQKSKQERAVKSAREQARNN